ncbi:MAG: hypothetical protein ACRDSF_08470 [Pseudonocardiaceae bacterium]
MQWYFRTVGDRDTHRGAFESGTVVALCGACRPRERLPGFTNLRVVRLPDGGVQLDPHAVGSCVIKLDAAEGRALGRVLRDWLG